MKTNYSSKSVNRKLSALKSYYRFLKRHAQISSNPAAKIIGPKKPQRLPTYIREKDMEKGLGIVVDNEFSAIRDRLIIELFYVTGMRRSELIDLNESSVNFSRMELKIVGKGNKERLVPISPEINDLLKQYLLLRNERWTLATGGVLLLTDKGKPIYPKLVYNIVKNWLSRVSTAQKLSPHVLRHSFATHLADRGAELNAIKDLLGHASLAATELYMHNTIEKLKGVYKGAHPRA
jgi:integrase/recombinase XerC